MENPKKTPSPPRTLARALTHSLLPTFLLDPHGKLVFANPPLLDLLNLPPDAWYGLDCHSPLPPDPAPFQLAAARLATPLPPQHSSLQILPWNPPNPPQTNLPLHLLMLDLEQPNPGFRLGIILDSLQSPELAQLLSDNPAAQNHLSLQHHFIELRSRYQRLDGLQALLGASPASHATLRQTQVAIDSHLPVWLIGPAGIGKRETAQAIFAARMKRSEVPAWQYRFHPVECRLMDPSLMASVFELLESPIGLNPDASHQALYLHRVDLLSLDVVPILLPFLQKNRCQLLASSHTPDLSHLHPSHEPWLEFTRWIDIHRVTFSPLLQRPQDIPIVVEALLQELRTNLREPTKTSPPLRLDPQTLLSLQAYGFPHNVRELRNILASAAEACLKEHSTIISPHHLPISVRTYPSYIASKQRDQVSIDLDKLLEDVEKTAILQMIERFPKNRSLAAKHLGISRTRLLRRLEQWGLASEEDDSLPESTSSPNQTSPLPIATETASPKPKKQPTPKSPRPEISPPLSPPSNSLEEIEFIEVDPPETPEDRS